MLENLTIKRVTLSEVCRRAVEGAVAPIEVAGHKEFGILNPAYILLVAKANNNYGLAKIDRCRFSRKGPADEANKQAFFYEAAVRFWLGQAYHCGRASGKTPEKSLFEAIKNPLGSFCPNLSGLELLEHEELKITSLDWPMPKNVVIARVGKDQMVWKTIGVATGSVDALFGALADGVVCYMLNEGTSNQFNRLTFHS